MCTHKTFKQQAKCKEYSKQSILDDIRDKASSPQKKKKTNLRLIHFHQHRKIRIGKIEYFDPRMSNCQLRPLY